MTQHFVRIGAFGHVGRFRGASGAGYQRGQRVVCRTVRGLEVGEVLAPADRDTSAETADGQLLRVMTPEDELLLARLEKNRDRAYQACQSMLDERGVAAVLMDVEHLLDGKSLYFYFLGEISPEVEALTADLAEVYDATVRFRKFAESVAQGCGPGCGTEQAQSGGCSTSCGTCALKGLCATKPA